MSGTKWLVLLFVAAGCGGSSAGSTTPEDERALPWERADGESPLVESPLYVIVGATILTAAGPTYDNGILVMEDGRIVAVGSADELEVPRNARVIDGSGRYVTPGLIDSHSHIGVYAEPSVHATRDGNEATSPTTPEVWAGASFWPQDAALPRALAGGVTSMLVLPGSANLIGGRGVTLKVRPGARTVEDLLFPGAPDTLKMACGENPKRVYGGRNTAPSTRMGNVAGYRAALQSAVEYGRSYRDWQHEERLWRSKHEAFEASEGEGEAEDPGPAPAPPDRDFGLEALLGAIEGRVLVQMHCYRADEMALMMGLMEEFGFQVRGFHHAVEAYKIRDLLAEREVSVSTWADWWGFKLEAFDTVEENLALVTQAGGRGVLHSDDPMLIQRLNQEAAKALTAGRRAGIALSDDQALRWITANPAWTLGIEDHTGMLEAGKMADVVVWNRHPFSVYARADLVFVDGVLRYDRREGYAISDFEVGHGASEPSPVERP